MKKIKSYIYKVLYYVYKFLGMSLNFPIIDNEIRNGISNVKYNKYNLPIVIVSIVQKSNGDIEIELEYPLNEITKITLSSSQKGIEITGVDSTTSQLDLGRIYNTIQNIIDDINYSPSKEFSKKIKDSFRGRNK